MGPSLWRGGPSLYLSGLSSESIIKDQIPSNGSVTAKHFSRGFQIKEEPTYFLRCWVVTIQLNGVMSLGVCAATLHLLGTGFEFAADWGLLCCGTTQIFVPITVHWAPIAAESSSSSSSSNRPIFWARMAVFVPTWQMEHGAYQMRTLIKWTSVKFWWLVGIVARQRHREKDKNWDSWIYSLIHQWSLYIYYYLLKQQAAMETVNKDCKLYANG